MSEDRIERIVERRIDSLDRRYLRGLRADTALTAFHPSPVEAGLQ